MIDAKEFEQLQKRAETARATRDRAQGSYDAALATLLNKFGCQTLEEAEKLAAQYQAEADEAEAEYDKAKAQFEEEWANVIG